MKRIVLLIAVVTSMLISTNVEAASPKTETVNFWVSIHCTSCQQRIMENLPFERGVKDIVVDVAAKSVEVKYNTKRTDSDKIRLAIEKLGYEVHDYATATAEPVKMNAKCAGHSTEAKADGCCNSKDPNHVCCKDKKGADHKCTGHTDPNHKCTGHKDADHKCTGQKAPDHKCTGQKDAEHKCNHGSK